MQPAIVQYLRNHSEKMPEWLERFQPGDRVSFAEVMSGRIGYYPGSGSDGQLIKLGNMSHTVHTYLYVDYLERRERIRESLIRPGSIRGYHILGRMEFNKEDLLPNGPYPLFTRRVPRCSPDTFRRNMPDEWYCEMFIWERDADRSSAWGAQRFATVFLCEDGIETYYQLFVKEYVKAPWIMLLQDHGFGCNYDSFGKGGILEEIIIRSDIRPLFVLVGKNTRIWPGYQKLDCAPEIGGMNHMQRYLYVRDSNASQYPLKIESNTRDSLLDELIQYVSTLSIEQRKELRVSDMIRRFCVGYPRANRLLHQLRQYSSITLK